MKLPYSLRSGKNNKLLYYLHNIALGAIPHSFNQTFEKILTEARNRPDFSYILERVNYYCRLTAPVADAATSLSDLRRNEVGTVYYFDIKNALRPFPADTQFNFLPGDVRIVPPVPTLTKSRPIYEDNRNSVLLKLNKVRHFIFVNDSRPYADKLDKAIFRGKVKDKPKRHTLFSLYFGNPMFDLGDTSTHGNPVWRTKKISIADQLRYKFILSIEGNDVASNLKWVMNSRSCAVMPKPEFETWFMEGKLKGNVHYIEISKDYHDLEEKLKYFRHHPDEAEAIINNANQYVKQFFDSRREKIIETLTIGKYLGKLDGSGWLIPNNGN